MQAQILDYQRPPRLRRTCRILHWILTPLTIVLFAVPFAAVRDIALPTFVFLFVSPFNNWHKLALLTAWAGLFTSVIALVVIGRKTLYLIMTIVEVILLISASYFFRRMNGFDIGILDLHQSFPFYTISCLLVVNATYRAMSRFEA